MNFKKRQLGLLESLGLMACLLLVANFLWDWHLSQAAGGNFIRNKAQILAKSTKAKLDEVENSANALLAAWGEAYGQGVIKPADPQILNPLFKGHMLAIPFITSINTGTSLGEGYLILREGDRWKNRIKKADDKGVITWHELDRRGRASSTETRRDNYDPRLRPWYQQTLAKEGVVWSEPYVFLTTKDPGITASRRFIGPTGETAVIGIDIMLRDLALILAAALREQPEGSAAFLLDDQGKLIATSELPAFETYLRAGQLLDSPAIFQAFPLLDAGQSLRREAFRGDIAWRGIDFLGAAENILFAEGPPWRLIIFLPRQALLAPYLQIAGWKTLSFLILVVLGVIWYARRFLLPIKQVTKAISQSREAPWQIPVALTKRADEIGLLAKELDNLNREIASRGKALEASSLLWRQTMDSLDLFVSVHDEDLRILKANKPLAEFFGLHPRDLIGEKCYRLIHETDEPHPLCPHHQTRETGIAAQIEIHRADDDRYFEVKTTPLKRAEQTLFATVHIMRDVTGERKREERLIESEGKYRELAQRFQSLLNAVPDSIMVLDRQLKIIWANAAAANTINRTPEEMEGFACYSLLHGRSEPCGPAACAVIRSLASGREEQLVKVDFAGRLRDIRAVPLKAEDGTVTGAIEVARDITEMKKVEEGLRESRKQEALVRLTAGIAHDFNNIINIILGYTHILKLRLGENAAGRELAEIDKAVQRAAALTKNLQAIVGRLKMARKPMDLNMFLLKARQTLTGELGPTIDLILDLADTELLINADGEQLELVLINLAVNAKEAMPGGGRVTIKTTRADLPPDGWPGKERPSGPLARLTFMDNGQGMDEETARRVLEPFFTTKEKARATGLGLPVADGIVKQHGGMITWVSAPGQGTTVTLFFPLLQETLPRKEQDLRAAAPAIMARERTILLAEDETALRELTQEILTQVGFTVVAAADGREGLKLFEENPEKFDLLLLDVRMPHLGGIAFAQMAKKLCPGVKIVLLTGNVLDLPPEVGGVAVIAKPFLPGELIKGIQQALE